jgi:hypothetical protein
MDSLFKKDTIHLSLVRKGSSMVFLKNGLLHFSSHSTQKQFDKNTKECDSNNGCAQWRYNNTKEVIGFWLYKYDTSLQDEFKLWTDVTTYDYKIQRQGDSSLFLIKLTGKIKGHVNVRLSADTRVVREHLMVELKIHDGRYCITGLDKNFEFSYDNLHADTTEIRLTTIGIFKDTIFGNIIIKDYNTTHVELIYPPFCEFDNSKSDSACTVCRKVDQLKSIVYEPYYNPPKGKRKTRKYLKNHNFKTGCDPHWYCLRDDKKF